MHTNDAVTRGSPGYVPSHGEFLVSQDPFRLHDQFSSKGVNVRYKVIAGGFGGVCLNLHLPEGVVDALITCTSKITIPKLRMSLFLGLSQHKLSTYESSYQSGQTFMLEQRINHSQGYLA